MYTKSFTNPKTNRVNSMKCWDLDTKSVANVMSAAGGNVKAISWAMLNDEASVQAMEDTQHGDSAANNWALNVFENALDWGLGLAVVGYLRMYKEQFGKFPRRFTIAANRNGDVFCVQKSGNLIAL